MTGDDFREIVLSMPEAIERAHMGHPDFRANGKIFASLHANEESGTLKLSPEEQREFRRSHPGVFAAASGAWGRQGWTVVGLKGAEKAAVRAAALLAWEHVAQAPRARPRSLKAAGRSKAKGSRRRRR